MYNGVVEYYDRQKTRQFLYSKMTIIVIVFFVIMLIPGVYGIYKKVGESSKDRITAERELADLVKREGMLEEKVNRGNTDRGLEEQIREKFNVAKEGESVIVLVEKPVVASTTQNEANVFKAVWQRLKKAF